MSRLQDQLTRTSEESLSGQREPNFLLGSKEMIECELASRKGFSKSPIPLSTVKQLDARLTSSNHGEVIRCAEKVVVDLKRARSKRPFYLEDFEMVDPNFKCQEHHQNRI